MDDGQTGGVTVRAERGERDEGQRKTLAPIAERLHAGGFDAVAYHAGLDNDVRRRRQEAFVRDVVSVIVATITSVPHAEATRHNPWWAA